MPNYEITRKYCHLRKKDVTCPATYTSEPKGDKKLLHEVNDCFNKEMECQKLGCKFSEGKKDPFSQSVS